MYCDIEGGNAYYNTDGTITVQAIPEELLKLRKENAALQHLVRQSESKAREAERQLTTATRKYDDDCRQYRHLLDAARAEVNAQEKAYREQREIDHLERMELWAWRKTEKARKKREARLRARIQKTRRQAKVNAAIAGDKDYAITAKTQRECAIAPDRLEISNAIIALAEYLRPYNPTEEFQTYLWDCRTVQTLLEDMRESIVRATFGPDWEALLLAGLIGLHIVDTPPLASIADPASAGGVTVVPPA